MNYAIGNLVKVKKMVYIIDQIGYKYKLHLECVHDKQFTGNFDADEITPIPLTPEILQKLGFNIISKENIKTIYEILIPHKRIINLINYTDLNFFKIDGVDCAFEFLHQLQNIAKFVYNVDFNLSEVINYLDNKGQK